MSIVFKNFFNTLRRHKVASILNLIGMSVAFAAFAIIMMQVRYDLTYDRFHPKAERIFRVERATNPLFARPMARAICDVSSQIVREAVYRPGAWNFSADDQSYIHQTILYHTPGLIDMLDFRIVAGDTSTLARPRMVMLARSVAERFFAGSDPIGRQLLMEDDSSSFEVAAVFEDFPKNSIFPNAVYMAMGEENDDSWNNQNYCLLVELRTADPTRARDDIRTAVFPEEWQDQPSVLRLTALPDIYFQNDIPVDYFKPESGSRATTYTLLLIALLIVLIAAINFVNFSTSMVPMRLRSVNTRRVMGSSVGSIRAAMIFEALGLCLIALLVACWIVAILGTSSFTAFMDVDIAFSNNLPTIALTALVALTTGLVAGLYPAWYITSFQPALVLKGSFGLSPKGKRLRTMLIAVQYVISLVLIVVALAIHLQNDFLRRYPLGFDQQNILVAMISQSLGGRSEALTAELRKNPSIEGVAYAGNPLVSARKMGWGRGDAEGNKIHLDVLPVSADFPEVMGMEVVEGRGFTPADEQSENGTFLFNRTAWSQYNLSLSSRIIGHTDQPAAIAGYVKDFHARPLHYGIQPFTFYVFGAEPWQTLRIVYIRVAAGADLPATIESIRRTITRMDPRQGEVEVDFFDATIGRLYAKEQRLAALITLFSALAILISMIGVFGLILFETQYRRKEIGIRKVHGATIGQVLKLLNGGLLRIVAICFVVAAPIAWYFVRKWLEGFAYHTPIVWWIFALALLAVLLLTLLTVTLLSYRTATENPINSIKTE